MSMDSEPNLEFEQLISRLLDRGLAASERQRLESLLKGHASRQKIYLDSLATHLLLEKEGALQADVEAMPIKSDKAIASRQRHRTGVNTQKDRSSTFYNFVLSLAAILLLATGGIAAINFWPASEPLIAKVIDSTDVMGAPAELIAEGALIDIGLPLQFDSGLLAIKMPTGAEFVLEGPASLTVQGLNQVLLDKGKLYAKVPPTGHGFTVETKETSLIDHGTEFGVIARSDGLTKSYVYKGLVEAAKDDQSFMLKAGMSIVASVNKGLSSPERFKRSDITFKKSLDGDSYISQVKELGPLYYHRFSSSNYRRSLCDEINQDQHHANIRGGVYISNGGPVMSPMMRDGYLRFVGVESVAEIRNAMDSIYETGAYSILLWVRIDEEGPQGIVALTDNLGPDAQLSLQLRLSEEDRLEHCCYLARNSRSSKLEAVVQRSDVRLERGVWHQVALTGGNARNLNLYLNGKQAAVTMAMSGAMIADCHRLLLGSGSGRDGEKKNHTGPLRGAIDELVVFDRCLTAKEIRQVYMTAKNSTDLAAL